MLSGIDLIRNCLVTNLDHPNEIWNGSASYRIPPRADSPAPANAIAVNLIWHRVVHAGLLVDGVHPAFVRDVTVRYALGLTAYAAATLGAFVSPVAAVLVTVALALVFLLGPAPRSGLAQCGTGTGLS